MDFRDGPLVIRHLHVFCMNCWTWKAQRSRKHNCQPFCGPEGRFDSSDSVFSLWPTLLSYLCVQMRILCGLKTVCCCTINPDCCLRLRGLEFWPTLLPVVYHSTPFQLGTMRPGSVELQLETCHHKDNSRDSTVNAGDNPDQPPAPPMLHSLRPHKLCQFSGEEGDAEDFIREANLFLELQPMADPAAAGWLLGSLEGRAKQEELSMGAGDITLLARSLSSWNSTGVNIATPPPLLGHSLHTSRGWQSRWGSTLPTFASSGRKRTLSRLAPSPKSCCRTLLWVVCILCLARGTSSTTSKRMRMQHLPVLRERPSAGWERTAALTSTLPVVYHSIPWQPGAASRILCVLKIVCCCAINPDCRLHLLWSQIWTVVYHSSPLHMCWTEWGSMSAWVEVGSWRAPCRFSYHSRQGPTRSIQNGIPDDMAPTEDGEGYQILWTLCRHNFVSINLYKFYTSHQTLHCLRSTLHCLRSISTIQSNCLL